MMGLAVQAVDEKRLAAFSVAWHHLVLGLRTATQPRNFIEFEMLNREIVWIYSVYFSVRYY